MPLNDLDQPELERLIDALLKVGEATQPLHRDELNPRIDLTPGNEVRIRVGFTIPEASAPSPIDSFLARRGEYLDRQLADRFPPSPEAAPDLTQSGEADPARSVPEETPPAAGDSAGGTLSAAPEADADDVVFPEADASVSLAPAASDVEDAAEGGGGSGNGSGSQAPAAPVPGSAGALAESAGGTKVLWTEEEDDRLVAFIVDQVTNKGLTKAAALPLAAAELGRPAPGTEFRANRKLKERINAAIFAAATRQAQTEIPQAARQDAPPPQADVQGESAVPHGGDAPAAEPEPAAGATPAPAEKSFVADPVISHLMSLPDKGGWTVERDLELMELSIAGWQPNEIALQLQVQANLVKPRFDMLTGIYEDANGKKVRRFSREAVFAALQRLAGKAA